MIKVFDMFSSNGSTWFNKTYFKNQVIKNDIRKGKFEIYKQTISINPDVMINAFEPSSDFVNIKADLVYLDPPHLKFGSTGIMVQKYGVLPEHVSSAMNSMFWNASQIAPIAILKWNDNFMSIKEILKYAEPYFIIGFGNRRSSNTNTTHFITLIRKENNE